MWNLGNKMTTDGMVIHTMRRIVSFVYTYLNPIKWEIKVCCFTDLESKYVWTFNDYCGTDKRIPGIGGSKKDEVMQGTNIVHKLLRGLEKEAL